MHFQNAAPRGSTLSPFNYKNTFQARSTHNSAWICLGFLILGAIVFCRTVRTGKWTRFLENNSSTPNACEYPNCLTIKRWHIYAPSCTRTRKRGSVDPPVLYPNEREHNTSRDKRVCVYVSSSKRPRRMSGNWRHPNTSSNLGESPTADRSQNTSLRI